MIGTSERAFDILAGVLQGCPLSATLFVLAMQPFIDFVSSRLRPSEAIFGCADDLLAVVSCLESWIVLQKAFDYFEAISGLTLNVKKMYTIPLCLKPCGDSLLQFASMLDSHRLFKGINPCLSLKYLGFILGPRSASFKWTKVISKFRRRAQDIAASQTASSLLAVAYTSRVLPVLSYISQLEDFPPELASVERNVLHKIFKMIPGTFTDRALLNTHQLGLHFLPSLEIYCFCARYRTATRTIPDAVIAGRHILMEALASDETTLENLHRRSLSTPDWDTEPFAARLFKYTLDLTPLLESLNVARGVCADGVVDRIAAIPNDYAYQRSCMRILHESFIKHDWAQFLARRFHLTFGARIQAVDVKQALELCTDIRSLLTFSFLRWTLNSLPTADRLHDSGHDSCPFCGLPNVTTSHLVTCRLALTAVTGFMSNGQVESAEHAVAPFLSSFVSLRVGQASQSVTIRNPTKETDFQQPLTLAQHISILLGLYANSALELQVYWRRLFLLQQAFIGLRRAQKIMNLRDSNDRDVLSSHFRAASLCLAR